MTSKKLPRPTARAAGPTEPQLAALDRFAARHRNHPHGWKEKLWNVWMSGAYGNTPDHPDDSGYLQQIRNNFGPKWLETYEPKEIEP